MELPIVLVIWAASVLMGAALGHYRRNLTPGIMLPVLLGPLGLIAAVAFVRPAGERR